jgi:hypothetical protein
MARTTTLALLIGTLLSAGAATATTPGPVCRTECAPRIEQDCGSLAGRKFKRCRKKLVRACKASTPELACALDGAGLPGGDDGDTRPGGGDASAALTEALGDKLVTIGTSRSFSSGSITETQEIRLCRSGSVLLTVTTITSTFGDFSNTFDSTETFDGTWRVRLVDAATVLELAVGEAEPRRLTVAGDSTGRLIVDGVVADVADATGPCGGTPADGTPGGGTPADVAQQVADALAGHALVVTETNAGFGVRTTVLVLCASTRYVEDVTISAAPGFVDESIGTWAVVLVGGAPVLVLTDDQDGSAVRFAVTVDAQGNLLLNGLSANEGDPSAVPGICAQL